MQPPDWVCRKIEEMHPVCRLGYSGGDEFALVELWRVREAPETILGVPFLGHVYGSTYDRLSRVPLQVASVSILSVFDGSVLDMVKHMLRSFRERAIEMRRQQGLEEELELNGAIEQMGDEWWHAMHRDGAPRSPVVAKKFMTPEEKKLAAGESIDPPWRDRYIDDFNRMQASGVGRPIK